MTTLQDKVTSLQTAFGAINPEMSDKDLTKAITNVKSKASTLNKAMKKLKK